jgi:hypothetical protein
VWCTPSVRTGWVRRRLSRRSALDAARRQPCVARWLLAVAAVALLLTGACGPAARPPSATPALSTPVAAPAAAATQAPAPAVPSPPTASPAATQTIAGTAAQTATNAALADAASRLGVPASQVQVRRVEGREWPDTSLGCPQPNMLYAQVITPGYLVELSGAGRSLEYHTDRSGTRTVLCRETP